MNKVAAVTGAGTGIGRATALRLAKDGFSVAVCYSKSREGADQTVSMITEIGGSAKAFQVSIENEESVCSLFRSLIENYGRIDVLINNAGIGHFGKLKDVTMEEFDYVFGVNTRGTFMMCREAAKVIETGGSIVNISTGATTSNMPGQCLYTASKLAMEGFTKVLAKELGKQQVKVNIVSPGMTDTPLLEGGDAESLKQYGAQVAALRRCGEPEDIASAISALVSSDCAWITGQNLHVDGGSVIL
ncbi:3-oxoacyl-[acyl-carrier-protein] reductase [BD1-7 clade bacterium]|uniref:3-oxoacyl-[acyl-carrier-protein] reductase n=1 Tax=BD1-7 clade bacterium TaxID=2029982 RepID=A0A5S9N7L8_9GAMM|nr:3-oxoacyl-[acyl-carrier-protein] reductase [BD1-7 clade bacterium]